MATIASVERHITCLALLFIPEEPSKLQHVVGTYTQGAAGAEPLTDWGALRNALWQAQNVLNKK